MASRVLSLRLDGDLWERIRDHAAKRGMSAQDYVIRTLIREDFDERFMAAVEATDRFYGRQDISGAQTRPSAGIR
ncbi:BrnA antitoxin family protein [Streptomyces sp. PLK6-54]|uniref:BrnA antitoxin family protein n=1 Tax=Actinacidiphila acidipaludis TaxID=2873382 RepID=A0ABS7QH27_9ACTN|nr:BrnA antitoxin family protein [Streptomyces acidipaludis]MBY8882472.1 BrnA antitoxin family protein [Streptomyces acidipaludis]